MAEQPFGDLQPLCELGIGLAVEGGDGDRWRVRIELSPQDGLPVDLDGITVALVDGRGRPLGSAVVLPISGIVTDVMILRSAVPGPPVLDPGVRVRCTVFRSNGGAPVVVEAVASEGPAGPALPVRAVPAAPAGITDDEIEELAREYPWILGGDDGETGDDDAFLAFRNDLLSEAELDEDDPLTEELFRLLREG